MTMQRRGLPLAYVVTAGNQAQTGLSEIALGRLDDPQVTALGLHIEGFDSLRALEALAAKARALRKPVIAMKVGRSAEARAATLSHTARSEEHTSELQSLIRISYAVFCLNKKNNNNAYKHN